MAAVVDAECVGSPENETGLRRRKNASKAESDGDCETRQKKQLDNILADDQSFNNVVDMAHDRRDSLSSNDLSAESTSPESDSSTEDIVQLPEQSKPIVMKDLPRSTSFWRNVWTCTAVYFLVSIFCILGPIFALGWLLLPFTHGWWHLSAFVLAYFISQNLPPWYSRAYKEGWLGGILIRELANYMTPFKVIKEEPLDPSKKYIIGWHPHGRLFYGFGTFLGIFSEFFPELAGAGKHIFAGINDAMFRIPFISNWLYLCGNIPCSKRSVLSKLAGGNSVALIVGGIEEVLEGTFDDRDVLYILRRKGFCKLALDTGAGLVPIFCFGENQIFTHHRRDGFLGLDFWRRVNKVVKLGAPFPMRGVLGLPIPHRVPMLIAVGRPLFARPGESVESLHSRYVAAVTALYAAHVGASAQPDRRLVLI